MIYRTILIPAVATAAYGCGNQQQQQETSDPQTEQVLREWRVQPQRVEPAALRSAVEDADVRRFYESRGWQAAWTQERADALVRAIGNAGQHALKQASFLPRSAPSEPERIEAALTKAAIDYGGALANGMIDPNEIAEIYTVPRPDADAATGLGKAVAGDTLSDWLSSLAPQTPEYRALSKAYLEYRRQAAREGENAIQSGDLIHEGDSDPRVPRIVEALRANGYLRGEQAQRQEPQRYTTEIAQAVERMQDDFGIRTDGIVGPETLEVLNTGSADRARQLAVNLERLRWLERNPPATRVDVNTAAAELDYWRDGQHRDHRRVVVGQPGWETPRLGSPMFRLVANPTWTVPKSIEEEEIAGKGPGYLRRNNMVRRDGWIVQLPGPDNALGEVKFDMRNDHSIYLHDTPAKHLFQQSQRQRSHGCVRVENALQFARMLARDDGILPKFDQALATGEETFVSLNSEVPVRLLYHTAFVDRGGAVRFRTDAYGWDDGVAEALGLERRNGRKLRTHVQDIGP